MAIFKKIKFSWSTDSKITTKILLTILMPTYVLFHVLRLKKLKMLFGGIKFITKVDNIIFHHTVEQFTNIYEMWMISPDDLFKSKMNEEAIDLGAHIGCYGLKLSKETGSKVYAVEADTKNYETLCQNIKANHLENKVIPVHCAITDKSGELKLYNASITSGSSLFQGDSGHSEIVQSKTLKQLIDEYKIKPSLIKIDIEGCEESVLVNSINLLKKIKPKLIIEIHPPYSNANKIKELLIKNNYQYFEYTAFQYRGKGFPPIIYAY